MLEQIVTDVVIGTVGVVAVFVTPIAAAAIVPVERILHGLFGLFEKKEDYRPYSQKTNSEIEGSE